MKLNVKDYPIYLAKRLIKFLQRVGVIKNYYTFVYKGKGISLNDFYSSGHWYKRKAIVDKYHKIFDDMVYSVLKERNIDKYSIFILYNSRHDPDNVIGMEKVFIDVLRGKSGRKPIIVDDNKKHCKFVGVMPDFSLENNTFEFILIIH